MSNFIYLAKVLFSPSDQRKSGAYRHHTRNQPSIDDAADETTTYMKTELPNKSIKTIQSQTYQ